MSILFIKSLIILLLSLGPLGMIEKLPSLGQLVLLFIAVPAFILTVFSGLFLLTDLVAPVWLSIAVAFFGTVSVLMFLYGIAAGDDEE